MVKSLETNFRKVPGLSGATVMGDGSVALILDVAHLVRLSGRDGAMLLTEPSTRHALPRRKGVRNDKRMGTRFPLHPVDFLSERGL